MKKLYTFILPPFIIVILFLFSAKTYTQSIPAPYGLEDSPTLAVNFYMSPIIISALLLALFIIEKKPRI